MWNNDRYTVDGIAPIMYITENGVDVPLENEIPMELALNDRFRVEYYRYIRYFLVFFIVHIIIT